MDHKIPKVPVLPDYVPLEAPTLRPGAVQDRFGSRTASSWLSWSLWAIVGLFAFGAIMHWVFRI